MKTFIARIAVICISSYQLQAQVSFTLSSSLGVGSGPWWVTAADVNGDGKVDLITANYMANTLSVLTNNGSGGFVLASSPTVGNAPWCVTAADVNGDGKVDLISANFGGGSGNTLTVLTNNGSGGFVLASSPVVGSGPVSVTAADVNGDGKVDLICANYSGNSLSVLTNNGSGGFVLAGNYTVGTSPRSVVAADVNRDGKMDLVCANLGGATLSVLTNNGSGGFVTAGTYSVGYEPDSAIAADVNGDGNVDLICGNYGAGSGNTLSILTNNGSGGFVLASSPLVGSGPVSVTAADVNGDGNVDLICAGIGGTALTVLTNNGSGSFMLASSPSVGSAPYGVTAADVNGDGKLDLISANRDASTLTVLTNTTLFPKSSLPIITAQPAGLTNAAGSTASFSVGATATGTEPARQLSYQWRLTGTNLPAATNNILALPNLTLAQAGTYDVVISNYVGSVTSTPAVLAVNFILVKVNGQIASGTVTTVAPAQVAILGGYPGGYLFYTLDGSTPTASSTFYNGPFNLTSSATLQVLSLSSDFNQMAYGAPVNIQIVPVYNLLTSVVGNGTLVTNPPSGPYLSNSMVTLTAYPASNWSFDHWAVDASGSQNPVNITMNGFRNVQAVFVQTANPLTLSTPGGGSVTANGQTIAPGTFYTNSTMVTLTATPAGGWSFLGWRGDASGTNNPLNITINQTNNIQAIFGTAVGTNTAGGGSIVLSQPNPVAYGTVLTASAVPNPGNYLLTWGGSASGTNAPTTITVTNAIPNISALFSALPGGEYSLSVIVMGNGSVAISPQKSYYNAGDSVTLRATPTNAATGFYGWAKDASGTANPLTVLMNTNKTVLAYFTGVSAMNLSLFFCPALTINGTVGYSYTIQSTTDLTNPNSWVTLTNLTLTQPVQIWVDTSVNAGSPFNPKYFYRALPQQ